MLPPSLEDLSLKLRAFPGMGSRSSRKLALDLLEMNPEEFEQLQSSMTNVRKKVVFCYNCGFFAEATEAQPVCHICSDKSRRDEQICLLEKPTDVLTIEKSQSFRGRYHVLKNLISPLDNVFAENTTINDLFDRRIPQLKSKEVELILFFKSGFSAEATTAYLKDLISSKGLSSKVKLTRLAQGLPLYFNPDTLDQATMVKALEDRKEV